MNNMGECTLKSGSNEETLVFAAGEDVVIKPL